MKLVKPFTLLLLVASFLCAQNVSSSGPRGTVPQPAAGAYSAHAEQEGAQIGATLLTHKQARKAFVLADMDQCCLVVEVAFYPAKNNFVRISLDDFMLREAGKDLGVKPSTADVLAAQLEVRPPAPQSDQKVGVSSSSEVGYERGQSRDPYTGATTSRTGVYQRQSVGVGIPIGGKQQTPETTAEQGRLAIQNELTEKALPETSVWEPVAGYLYFSVPKKSRGKDGYELVYTMGEKKIVLPLK
jgi:hypothetical protein